MSVPVADPLAAAPDQAAAATPEPAAPSAPPPESRPLPGRRPFDFGQALMDTPDSPALNGRPAAADTATAQPPADPPVGESAPEADTPATPDAADDASKPKDSRRDAGREGNLARIAELEASLKAAEDAKVAHEAAIAAAAEQARADERARIEREAQAAQAASASSVADEQRRADLARFDRLQQVPDTEISVEDYNWREEQKQKLAMFPDVRAHYQTWAEEKAEQARQEALAGQQAYQDEQQRQILLSAKLPGVKIEDLRRDAPTPLRTWDAMAEYFHRTGGEVVAAAKDAEYQPKIDELTEKLSQAEDRIRDLELVGPRGLGARRAPLPAGRSASTAGGPPVFDPSRNARDNLGAALMG